MAEHHLPPEPAVVDHHDKGVHAGDLKPASRRGRRYGYYYGEGGGGGLRALCFAVLVLLLIVGITWLVLYLVYRPSDPTVAVTSAAVLGIYNATATATTTTTGPPPGSAAIMAGAGACAGPTLIAASFQFTLVIGNPSARSSARYDRLTAYAAYRGAALTAPAPLPPLEQDAGTAVSVAPVLGGSTAEPVPVSPDAAAALAADVAYGVLPVRVVLLGRVRFVSGPFRGRWHSLYARCDMVLGGLRRTPPGGAAGSGGVAQAQPLLGNPVCNVDT